MVVAAEAWASSADTLAEDLRRELDERRRADKAQDDVEYVERYEAHRKQWGHLSVVVAPYADRRARETAEASS